MNIYVCGGKPVEVATEDTEAIELLEELFDIFIEGGYAEEQDIPLLDRIGAKLGKGNGAPIVPKVKRQETYVVQLWEESEAGWGVRPDGWSLHLSMADVDTYVKSYWDSMPNFVPSEYSRPRGRPYVVPGSVLTDEQIIDIGTGKRFWGRDYPEVP